MSKQLGFSATISVLTMAVFALSFTPGNTNFGAAHANGAATSAAAPSYFIEISNR